ITYKQLVYKSLWIFQRKEGYKALILSPRHRLLHSGIDPCSLLDPSIAPAPFLIQALILAPAALKRLRCLNANLLLISKIPSCSNLFMPIFLHSQVPSCPNSFMPKFLHAQIPSCPNSFMLKFLHAQIPSF